MKKLIMLMLILVTASINCFALSETAIFRHSGSEVTVYDGPSQLQTALNDALDGDTLYLGKGAYGGFEITKRIYVRGAGNGQTHITGSISINIDSDSEDPIVYTDPILEGLYIDSDIYLYQYTKGITVRKCDMNNFKLESGSHTNLTLDRCQVRNYFYYSLDMHEVSLINSKIYIIYNNGCTISDDFSIVNSNIYNLYYNSKFHGSFVNSILSTYNYGNFVSGTFINTLYYSGNYFTSSVYMEHCYSTKSTDYYDSTPETLLENGYLGTDGTVVGCYGGSTPFTLEMSVPAVDETRSKIEVDNAAKKLNVSIKLIGAPEDTEEDSTTQN